ncbi:MAG: tRNA pseudouridine(55) synthase TruB [Clostridiales bacterium]|nr:tRNA pseudouridine(55) synthase TruB [Clostridiales bacterium]
MDGYINLLKPPGMTSSDAVVRVRKMLPRGTRIGHGGTLDPDAAGVLPLLIGRGTRLFDYLIDKQKVYLAELRLGVTTDTQDASGAVVSVRPVIAGEAQLRAAIWRFVGDIDQSPPAYSAIQQNGRRMYELARAGLAQPLPPRRVRVDAIEYVDSPCPGAHRLRVYCGKGVYIRTLASDLGDAVGDGAHLAFLLRQSAGWFDISDARTLEELSAMGDLSGALVPLDAPLCALPAIELGGEHLRAAQNGGALPFAGAPAGRPLRVYVGGRFAGIGEASGDIVHFRAMLLEGAR